MKFQYPSLGRSSIAPTSAFRIVITLVLILGKWCMLQWHKVHVIRQNPSVN